MTDIAHLLAQIEHGDPVAAERLLPIVYAELRKLAARKLRNEKRGQTLDATGLVHEAYLRLAAGTDPQLWNSRNHFFAAAAEAMRRILVERARRRNARKYGGGRSRVDLEIADVPVVDNAPIDVLALDEALTKLAALAPAKAELVNLRYFAGLKMSEAAAVLGISLATAERHWAFARSWLYAELNDPREAKPA
jgi:RNA polymerase sigma factor (TIGR02999 family)